MYYFIIGEQVIQVGIYYPDTKHFEWRNGGIKWKGNDQYKELWINDAFLIIAAIKMHTLRNL